METVQMRFCYSFKGSTLVPILVILNLISGIMKAIAFALVLCQAKTLGETGEECS